MLQVNVWLVLGIAVSCGIAAAQSRPIDDIFAHYERIHTALSDDSLKGVSESAKALASETKGRSLTTASRAANRLAAAKDLKDARLEFAALSDALLPTLLKANITGVRGFICPMNSKRWAQRGDRVWNPYFGEKMANCGDPLK